MSSYFGSHNLMLMRLSFFIFLLLAGSPAASVTEAKDELLFDLSSREEMMQMAGYGEEKLSTVLVTGSVLCKGCLRGGDSRLISWPLSGAAVAVECHTQEELAINSIQGVTDEYGDFTIDLPSHLHAIPNLERNCAVKLLRAPKNSPCRPAYVRKHKGMTLSSVGNGIRTYTTGDIELVHSEAKPSQGCNKGEASIRKI